MAPFPMRSSGVCGSRRPWVGPGAEPLPTSVSPLGRTLTALAPHFLHRILPAESPGRAGLASSEQGRADPPGVQVADTMGRAPRVRGCPRLHTFTSRRAPPCCDASTRRPGLAQWRVLVSRGFSAKPRSAEHAPPLTHRESGAEMLATSRPPGTRDPTPHWFSNAKTEAALTPP